MWVCVQGQGGAHGSLLALQKGALEASSRTPESIDQYSLRQGDVLYLVDSNEIEGAEQKWEQREVLGAQVGSWENCGAEMRS